MRPAGSVTGMPGGFRLTFRSQNGDSQAWSRTLKNGLSHGSCPQPVIDEGVAAEWQGHTSSPRDSYLHPAVNEGTVRKHWPQNEDGKAGKGGSVAKSTHCLLKEDHSFVPST